MPAVQLLDVSSEILQAIVGECIISRAWKYDDFWEVYEPNFQRIFRLRLVCRAFNHVFQDALIQTGLLMHWAPLTGPFHHNNTIQPLAYWQTRKDNSAQILWHSYLVYMVQRGINPSVPYLPRTPQVSWCAEVREIAQSICNSVPESNLLDTIKALCWLGFGGELGGLGHFWESQYHSSHIPEGRREEARRNINLLSAAAYLNHLPLANELLQKRVNPNQSDMVFPAPIEAAARAGNIEMLQLLQQSLPDQIVTSERYSMQHSTMGDIHCGGKADPQAVAGAAARGNLQILEMALYPPSRIDANSTDYFGQPHGNVDPNSDPGRALMAAMLHSTTCEVYSRLASFFHDFYNYQPVVASFHIQMFAELGNFEIVKHLLERGVVWHGSSMRYPSSIHRAARHGRDDIVDLLLEHGGNINRPGIWKSGLPLSQAVLSGRLGFVTKMMDQGAFCDFNTLQQALFCEHPAMGKLVLSRYPVTSLLYGGQIWELLARARRENCTSVTNLLRKKVPGLGLVDWAGVLVPQAWFKSD